MSFDNSTDVQCPIEIPGFVHHGNCNLLCRPGTWVDVIVFYVGNYAAHAATVIGRPGERVENSCLIILLALVFPGSGLMRGLRAISSLAKFAKSDLQMAVRAGALLTVVKYSNVEALIEERANQRVPGPRLDDVELEAYDPHHDADAASVVSDAAAFTDDDSRELSRLDPRDEEDMFPLITNKIHGFCRLLEGYKLVAVPPSATFHDPVDETPILSEPLWRRLLRWAKTGFRTEPQAQMRICCSYNAIKVLVSIVQLLYATSTLYRTRGDQLTMYGYAAFGLTVAPYAWMSFVNLVGNLMCPQYDTMFIVESRDLIELREQLSGLPRQAERDRFSVPGTVGRLSDESLNDIYKGLSDRYYKLLAQRRLVRKPLRFMLHTLLATRFTVMSACNLVASMVPLVLVGAISGFHPGNSALYQRVWTMMWLVFGVMFGPTAAVIQLSSTNLIIPLFIVLMYGAPAIGGYVVVAHMISDFGDCVEL